MSIWRQMGGEGLATMISGLFIGVAWLCTDLYPLASVILYILAFVIGGYRKAMEGIQTLFKEKDIDVNLLMIAAATGAACIGYWAEGAILIFIFSLSGTLESYTLAKSSRDISSLMELKPETALRYQDGQEKEVAVEELNIGDVIIVKPGERLPADGVVKKGYSAVNQASITGEAIPVDKNVGDEVFAGTLNGQGVLFIEVTKSSESTLFAKIIKLVQEAKSEQPASQRVIKRFERIYAKIIIVVTLMLITIPPLFQLWEWTEAWYKAMVFLVVASPCALVASIMPATLAAISNGARQGILFKGGAYLEQLAQSKVVAFDKTGTLTKGHPIVTDLASFQGYTQEEMLQIAASMERLSTHPLAKAIVQSAEDAGLQLLAVEKFTAITGWGVVAELRGEQWQLGKPAMVDAEYLTEPIIQLLDRLQNEGKTVTMLQNRQGIIGVIALQDTLRPEARSAITKLKEKGIKVAMLTGDQEVTAQAIAKEAAIEQVDADLLPQDKVTRIKEWNETYGEVTMVGDGVNDAPALASASVGIAMGGTGSDAALETADLVLMNDNLHQIAQAIELGKRTQRIITQNLVFSIAVIALLILANFVHGISLPLGVIGHEGSTILVILNGLRLLRG